jgi:hypothetical protein
MSADHSIFISDPYGQRLAGPVAFVRLAYSRVVNDISTLTLTLPSSFDATMLRIPDGRVEVWRRLAGSNREYLDTDTTWLIKALDYDRDDQGRQTISVEADTPLCLLREPGRTIDYAAGSAYADKTDQLDDMMKAIVRENAGSLATVAGRNLAAYLSVAPDLSLAPSVNKAFAWRSVLRTLQEIAQTSAENGTYLAFDIVAPSTTGYEFRTYVQQRGVDRRYPSSQSPLVLSADRGNLGAGHLRFDYRDEVTRARAGGQGLEDARVTVAYQDDTRIALSPFGWREVFVEATMYTDDSAGGLTNEARQAVRAGRPRTIYQARILDTPDTRYGVHWAWGDYVTAEDFGRLFDCRVDAISVTVEGEGQQSETIEAWLRADDV